MNQILARIKAGDATVVDVRSRMEFMGGNAAGSINFPMDEIEERMEELRNMRNLVLCCASGNRSG
ncbi:MAG TPA: rhodanese-like domain-containing protein, partial [Bacteroidia bacterium]|nr:rhodanese-like domain-containing protein [Bacteroidia bacterium]